MTSVTLGIGGTSVHRSAPRPAANVGVAGPDDTAASAEDHLEGRAITLCPEVARVVLDDAPAGPGENRAVVLQDIDFLEQLERPVAADDTTSAAATEVPDVLDGLEGLLGLAFRICAGAGGFHDLGRHALRSVAVLARELLPEGGGVTAINATAMRTGMARAASRAQRCADTHTTTAATSSTTRASGMAPTPAENFDLPPSAKSVTSPYSAVKL